MLHVAQEAVGIREFPGVGFGQQMVLHHFFQRRQRLGILQEGNPPRLQQLQCLDDEFDFANSAASQLDVAIDFARLHHFVFNAQFRLGDFAQNPFAKRPRIAERLEHLEEFRGQRLVAGDTPGLDEHHPLPGLAPLRVIILVTAERTRQRAGVPLGPQAQVDPVKCSLRRQALDFSD